MPIRIILIQDCRTFLNTLYPKYCLCVLLLGVCFYWPYRVWSLEQYQDLQQPNKRTDKNSLLASLLRKALTMDVARLTSYEKKETIEKCIYRFTKEQFNFALSLYNTKVRMEREKINHVELYFWSDYFYNWFPVISLLVESLMLQNDSWQRRQLLLFTAE